MATPTVVPLSGAMLSSSIGGPFGSAVPGVPEVDEGPGRVGASAGAESEGPFAEGAALGVDVDPAHPLSASPRPMRTAMAAAMLLMRLMTGSMLSRGCGGAWQTSKAGTRSPLNRPAQGRRSGQRPSDRRDRSVLRRVRYGWLSGRSPRVAGRHSFPSLADRTRPGRHQVPGLSAVRLSQAGGRQACGDQSQDRSTAGGGWIGHVVPATPANPTS